MRLRWLYVLAALPVLTEYAETGSWPLTPREAVTDAVLTLVVVGLVWLACRFAARASARADKDGVTGLFNSARFHADLEREILRAERLNVPLTLVYIGLDNFKAVNDAVGHAEGDALLRHFAKLLVQNVRIQVDRCYRAAGDEFALILPSTEMAGAQVVLERIRRATAAEPSTLPRHGVGLSAGAAQLQKGETPRALLLRADSLMYDAKRGAKPSVRV